MCTAVINKWLKTISMTVTQDTVCLGFLKAFKKMDLPP
jgi:hypothetical protein